MVMVIHLNIKLIFSNHNLCEYHFVEYQSITCFSEIIMKSSLSDCK